VLVGFLLLGGDGRHPYTLRFQTAGQLVPGDDVQIGGRRIGSVEEIRLATDNQAEVDVVVEEPFAPLRDGTRAVIRATSLSGVANRYVALVPGSGPRLDDGTVLRTDDTTSIVDLDQLFNTFDAPTRRALQRVIRGSGRQFRGRGEQANAAARYFDPALSSTQRLVEEVGRDSRTLEAFLVETGRTMGALAERRSEITALVSNANQAAQGIADESENFSEALAGLPRTLRRANSTFVNLRATLDDLDVLVAESKPATRRLAPFLRELRPLLAAARPTIRDLRLAITRPGPDNDLLELVRKAPRLRSVASPSLRATTAALRRSTPVLDFARPYAPDLAGWLRDFGQGTANYDANGHFARVAPMFNIFTFTDDEERGLLEPRDPDERLVGLETGIFRRCPGAASQPPDDNSAPFTDDGLDCDPRQVPPGS
jgi:phospholipid/cholesterol/gamma-HCH transport system substrate-binding protein